MTGIYKIQSKIKPERIYIGSSVSINKRWSTHLGLLKENKHGSKKLQNHYNKYGKKDLLFSVVVGCGENDLIAFEQFYIDALNPWFNVRKIANSNIGNIPWNKGKRGQIPWNKGIKSSDETCRKLSESHKGKKLSEEQKRKIGEANRGKKRSKETCENISKALVGKYTLTEDHKKKLREINLGNKNALGNKSRTGMSLSDEHKKKIRESNMGKTMSEETKEKLRQANLGRKMSQETKNKISNALTGRVVTDEFRRKMSLIRRSIIEKNKIQKCKKES